MQQALLDADKAKRIDFCGDFKMFLEDNAAVLQIIWFSDEAHLHLNGYVSKQNTVKSRLSDLNGTEGRSDNRKCRIIRKTNEKDEGKYQLTLLLNLRYY
jgi:hypothetical protein